jgi:hypothetical protein
VKEMKKITMSLVALVVLSSGLIVAAPASAQNRYSSHNYGNHTVTRVHTEMNKPMVRIMPDRKYFTNHNLLMMHPEFRTMFPDQVFGRRIVFRDRDDVMSRINVDNFLTGPDSINIVYITIDHDSFVKLQNEMSIDNNVDISVNTGNNTVSFNTVAGNVTTGDVSIDMQ